jgi:hypothetical protein
MTSGRSYSIAICVAVFHLALPFRGFAATVFNAHSAMGINLSSVSYYTTEQPFINSFATSEQWVTRSNVVRDTHEEQYVDLDAHGWPISLRSKGEPAAQQFSSVGVVFLLGMPDTANGIYPSGLYVVLYDGQGTLSYGADAALVRRSPGRDLIRVTPSRNGIDLQIVATDPHHNSNYLRNIRVVTEENEAAALAGHIFNPAFLEFIQNFRALRFMDWFVTNGSTLASWNDRPLPNDAFFGTRKGVPIEIAVQLANAVSADAWMNVPVMADDNFMLQMATLVRSQLGNTQKVYVELSNEVWNPSFDQFRYAASQGHSLWPTRPSGNAGYEYNRNWYGMRTAQMCDIWRSVWHNDPRLVCVLGAQAAWSFSATEALKCSYWTQGAPCSSHGINAVAVAPYVGGEVPAAWTLQPDGGLFNLFRSFFLQTDPSIPPGGFLSEVIAWQKGYAKDLLPYRLPLLAYEGGQSFSNGTTDALNALYMAANRDARMAIVYTRYFQQWKAGGGQLFMYYNDIGLESKYGSWGAIESIMQSTSPAGSGPPKWQSIQKFVTETPCWWPGCIGLTESVK